MLLLQGKHKEDFIHYCPSAGRCPCTFWKARSHHRFLRKIKCHDLLPSFPELLLQNTIACDVECLRWVWVRCPGCNCSQAHADPWETAREPQCCAVFSSSWNPAVLLTLTQAQTQTHHHTGCYEESELRPSLTPLVWWFLMMNEIMLGKNPCYIEEDNFKHTSRSGGQNSCIGHNWCANVLFCLPKLNEM